MSAKIFFYVLKACIMAYVITKFFDSTLSQLEVKVRADFAAYSSLPKTRTKKLLRIELLKLVSFINLSRLSVKKSCISTVNTRKKHMCPFSAFLACNIYWRNKPSTVFPRISTLGLFQNQPLTGWGEEGGRWSALTQKLIWNIIKICQKSQNHERRNPRRHV